MPGEARFINGIKIDDRLISSMVDHVSGSPLYDTVVSHAGISMALSSISAAHDADIEDLQIQIANISGMETSANLVTFDDTALSPDITGENVQVIIENIKTYIDSETAEISSNFYPKTGGEILGEVVITTDPNLSANIKTIYHSSITNNVTYTLDEVDIQDTGYTCFKWQVQLIRVVSDSSCYYEVEAHCLPDKASSFSWTMFGSPDIGTTSITMTVVNSGDQYIRLICNTADSGWQSKVVRNVVM